MSACRLIPPARKLAIGLLVPGIVFFIGRVYPVGFHPNWNRSQVLLPQGDILGAAVLLHGLTDSPYSMRYLAQAWQQQGVVVVMPRLPGHGTGGAGERESRQGRRIIRPNTWFSSA